MAEFDDFNVKVENNEDWPIPIVQPAELTTSLTICQHSLHNDYSQRDKQQRLQNFKFNPHWRLEVEEWLKSQSDLKTIYHEHVFKVRIKKKKEQKTPTYFVSKNGDVILIGVN